MEAGADQADLLQQRLAEAVEVFGADPGVISMQVFRGVESPTSFALAIEWHSREAHAQFRETPRRTQWRALIDDVAAQGPSGAHFVCTSALASRSDPTMPGPQ
jgi:quinol monooxygenase YgiN